jgi:hypothetical protein
MCWNMQHAWEGQKQIQNYGRETRMETLQWLLEEILKYILEFEDSSGWRKRPIIGSFELWSPTSCCRNGRWTSSLTERLSVSQQILWYVKGIYEITRTPTSRWHWTTESRKGTKKGNKRGSNIGICNIANLENVKSWQYTMKAINACTESQWNWHMLHPGSGI